MRHDARLNLLLTPPPQPAYERGWGAPQPWHRTLTQLLVPLGVRTFEAHCGNEAMDIIEKNPIHLAVVDTRLPSICGMNVLQLVQRLSAQRLPEPPPETQTPPAQPGSAATASGAGIQFRMHMQQQTPDGQRIEVRFDACIQPSPAGTPATPAAPVIILIAPPAPQQDKQLLAEALKFNAFSVLSEPVDVNVALSVMARAMTRCFSGHWPLLDPPPGPLASDH